MKYCPSHCVTAATNDNFCYKCGVKLVDYKKCSCGKELNPVDKFCPNCGKKVL